MHAGTRQGHEPHVPNHLAAARGDNQPPTARPSGQAAGRMARRLFRIMAGRRKSPARHQCCRQKEQNP